MTLLNYNALMLDPNYLIHGVSAELRIESAVITGLTVIDKTTSVDTGQRGVDVEVLSPHCVVRYKELTDAGVARDSLRQAVIAFNDQVWRITSAKPRPTPGGELDGELMLHVEFMHPLSDEESS